MEDKKRISVFLPFLFLFLFSFTHTPLSRLPMTTSFASHRFTLLPSEDALAAAIDGDPEQGDDHLSVDDTLDALLARVGYGRFHTTLLVSLKLGLDRATANFLFVYRSFVVLVGWLIM